MVGRPMFARDNSPRTGYNTRGGLSTSQIAAQREGRRNAYYADGTPVPDGMTLNVAGWNTSGVGPGSPGYRGSGGTQGYSFQRQGGAESKRPDYSTSFGGLNEFYRQQQGMSDWDRLQGQAGMDQSDAEGSRMAQMSRAAAQQGDYETAAAFADALNARAAQRMAAQSGMPQAATDPWAGITTYGEQVGQGIPMTNQPVGSGRPLHSWEEQAKRRAEIMGDPFAPQLDPNSLEAQAMLDQAAVDNQRDMVPMGEGQFQTPYGTISNAPVVGGATFTNGQGSAGPGGTQTGYGGVQTGSQFFQESANRQRTANKFAAPQMGYNGRSADDLDAYAQRLLNTKQRLGKS